MTKMCPKCRQIDMVRLILWGMPDGEPDDDVYYVGGCIVPADMPDYKCLRCSTEFYKKKNEWRNRFIWDGLDGIEIQCRNCKEWVPASLEPGQHKCAAD